MPDRAKLYAQCDARFIQMLDAGAMEELALFDRQVDRGDINRDSVMVKTIGAAALRQLRAGHISKEDAVALAQTETRQYAKRQMTWFRNQVKPQKNIANITVQA